MGASCLIHARGATTAPYLERWGPLYRLTVYEKTESLGARLRTALRARRGGASAPFRGWRRLRDEVVFEAVTRTLGRPHAGAGTHGAEPPPSTDGQR